MSNKPELASAPAVASDQDEVYVMPQKFNPQKAKLGISKGLLIGLGVLLVISAAAAGYFLYDMWQKNKAADNSQLPVTSQPTTKTINQSPIVEPVSTSTLSATEATTTEPEINTTTTEPVLSAEPSEIVLLLLASDTDNDGLTDIEEAVIGTSAAKPDSDSDGFTDAKELFNGYSPVAPGEAQLIDDDFVNFFYTDFSTDNFRALGIKDWTVNSISALKQLRLTIDTGETIKISVVDNFENISVLNWYLQKNPGVALSEIEIIELPPDFTGLMSPDGTRAYLTDQRREKIYVFEYLVDSQDYMFRYPNIFRMLINNFKLGSRPISEIIDLNASSTPSDNNSTST